jgi:hypothetical protein
MSKGPNPKALEMAYRSIDNYVKHKYATALSPDRPKVKAKDVKFRPDLWLGKSTKPAKS